MLGFVFGAGKKDGNIIKGIMSKSIAVPFGEIDGAITPRLTRLITIIRKGGFKAKVSKHMLDFLVTHAAGVPLIAKLVMKHGLDIRTLARCNEDLTLFVDAMRESFKVLQALGYRIEPKSQNIIKILPGFVIVMGFRTLLLSKLGEVGLAYHVSQAPDEMNFLAQELEFLVTKSGLPSPAIRKVLSNY